MNDQLRAINVFLSSAARYDRHLISNTLLISFVYRLIIVIWREDAKVKYIHASKHLISNELSSFIVSSLVSEDLHAQIVTIDRKDKKTSFCYFLCHHILSPYIRISV